MANAANSQILIPQLRLEGQPSSLAAFPVPTCEQAKQGESEPTLSLLWDGHLDSVKQPEAGSRTDNFEASKRPGAFLEGEFYLQSGRRAAAVTSMLPSMRRDSRRSENSFIEQNETGTNRAVSHVGRRTHSPSVADFAAPPIAKLSDEHVPSFDSAKNSLGRSSSTCSSTSSSGAGDSVRTRRRSSIQYFGLQVNLRTSGSKQIEMHKYQSHDPSDDVVVEQETFTAEPDSVVADANNQDDGRVSICSSTAENDDSSDAGFPHGEVGSSAAELARNLPDLVDHMRRLRLEMEKCTKIYEAINLGHRASKGAFGDDMAAGANDDHAGMYRESDLFGHEDSYSSKTSGNSRDPYEGMSQEDYDNFGPPVTRGSMSVRRSQQIQKMPSQRPSLRMSMVSAVVQNVSYSVMWVSGECGISLRNFSTNKIGAQIAVLQQADGVTTGISNCRLGDQLVTVNDDRVEDLRFKDIVQKLKSTRRPISLGFRTNQNVQTSPTAASSLSRSTINSMSRTSSSRGFMNGTDYDDYGRPSQAASALDGGVDRQTYSSMRSSTSTLSDDVEIFCKEQEEMHSDIIVLLTETVLRCERLQQENLDQLQSLMQLAPNLQTAPSPQSVMALSSLAPVESPAAAAKIRASLLDASQLSRTAATTATSA